MSEDTDGASLTRIVSALERIASVLERVAATERTPHQSVEATRSRRKIKVDMPGTDAAAHLVSQAVSVPTEAPINIDDPVAMRERAGVRIQQLVAEASEVGCTMADVEEVIADVTGSADPAKLDLTALSRVILALTRLVKSHTAPTEESETDKQIRAHVLGHIRTLISHAATTGDGLAAAMMILHDHVEDAGDVEHLELAKLQALRTALLKNVGNVQTSSV